MDAKMACLTVLLFSCSSPESYASFHKIKYSGINNFNALSIKKKSSGSNVILESGENLSIKEYVVPPKLHHKKALNLALRNRTGKNFDETFHDKISHEKKRSKREERDFSEIDAPVENISNTTAPSAGNGRTPAYSQDFRSCGKIKVKAKEYTILENGTAYVPLFGMRFSEENYMIEDGRLLVCSDIFQKSGRRKRPEDSKSSRTLQMASLVCSCLSTAFIALFILMFIVDKDLRTLPGSCVLSLCVAQLVAYACTFVQYHVRDKGGCRVIGMFMFYFFLASFFWMNVMALDIWRSVKRSIVELRLCTGRSIRRQLSIYSLYAWGTPLAIAVSSISVHFLTNDDRFRLRFNLNNCWFERPEALWLYFAGPVLVLLGANFLSFAVVFRMLQAASKKGPVHSGSRGRRDLASRFVLCLKLSSLMGLSWLFGVVAEVAGQGWLRYPYVVLSALQGLFIFFSYAVNAKTKRAARSLFQFHSLSMPSSFDQSKTTRL